MLYHPQFSFFSFQRRQKLSARAKEYVPNCHFVTKSEAHVSKSDKFLARSEDVLVQSEKFLARSEDVLARSEDAPARSEDDRARSEDKPAPIYKQLIKRELRSGN